MMGSVVKKIKVKAVHRYNVNAEAVYDTLLDPAKAKTFMFATPVGKMIRAEIDPKVGGGFLFVDRRPEGDAAHYGKYLKLERPKEMAFEFAVQKDAPNSDLVTIEIVSLPKGCEVTLTHEMNADFEHLKDRVLQGWDGILDGLGEALRSASKGR
jgi:uncharacterized protein YndB with AHSA1/START domain